jgi:hypothetical protein
MRRRVGASWVDEPLAPDYWRKLNRQRLVQLRVDMEQDTVRLEGSETAELAKREAAFAKRSERARWRGLDPSAREEEHRFAQRRHRQDRTALTKAVEEAAAQNDDERLKNSARRILDGTTLLYALTPTPDSAARALAAGKPGMRAFFGYPDSNPLSTEPVGGHVVDDQAADYDWNDVTNNRRVVFNSPDSGGFRTLNGGKIFITEPSRTKATNALRVELGIQGRFDSVTDVLKHESQHEVDRIHSQDMERMGKRRATASSAAIALAEYQTEFRAYTAQEPDWLWTPLTRREEQTLERLGLAFTGAHQPPSRADPNAPGFADWVQLKIFVHIYTHYPNVKKEWDKATLVRKKRGTETKQNRWFRDEVLRTSGGLDHLSANPNNSPRIERFWPAFDTASKRDQPNLESDAMSALVAVLKQLDANDRAALKRNIYYQRLEIQKWLRDTVDAVLRNPHADVTPILDSETAARAAARRQKEETERRAKRAQPPSAQDLETANIAAWDDVEALLDAPVTTTRDSTPWREDSRITDELTDMRSFYAVPSPKELGYFVSKVSQFVDLWPALDARHPQ